MSKNDTPTPWSEGDERAARAALREACGENTYLSTGTDERRALAAIKAAILAERARVAGEREKQAEASRTLAEGRVEGEYVDPFLLMRNGGEWLGAARRWLQWNTHNGSRVTWGSEDVISPPLTVRQVEELAAHVAAAALNQRRRR